MKNFFISLIFVISCNIGCGTVVKRPTSDRNFLFPNGKYNQHIRVNILQESQKRDFEFDCVVSKSDQELTMYGYNYLGLTLFKISEKDGAVRLESSIDEIQKNIQFFTKVYKLVKRVFYLKKQDIDSKRHSTLIGDLDANASLTFSDIQKGIPFETQLISSGQYQVHVRIRSLKLEL